MTTGRFSRLHRRLSEINSPCRQAVSTRWKAHLNFCPKLLDFVVRSVSAPVQVDYYQKYRLASAATCPCFVSSIFAQDSMSLIRSNYPTTRSTYVMKFYRESGGLSAFWIAGFILLSLLVHASAQTAPASQSPRLALHQLGIAWSRDGFHNAVMQQDYAAVELFFKGGWKPKELQGLRRPIVYDLVILVSKRGLLANDQRMVDLFVKYDVDKGVDPCELHTPVAFLYQPYLNDAVSTPAATSALRGYCDTPEELKVLQANIDLAKTKRNVRDFRVWSGYYTLLTGKG